MMDDTDRLLINALQGGFPLCDRPFQDVAQQLDIDENDAITRLQRLVDDGVLSRFGPLYDVTAFGGAVTLAAIAVPEGRFDHVKEIVNAYPEVAHNYAREHWLNMWFVVSAEDPTRIAEVMEDIAAETGLNVLDMPKTEEYFLDLRLRA